MSALRGEVWLVDFGDPLGHEQGGRRPAVIVSADGLNQSPAGVVVVVPCTTTPRGLPSHIELDPSMTDLSQVSYAKCEDMKSVSEQRLIARVGKADPQTMFAIERAVRFLLDL